MSIDYTLRATRTLSQSKKLEIFNDAKQVILKGSHGLFTEGLDSFLNDFTLIPFTLTIKNTQDQVVFSLHKKRSSPLSAINYVIIYSGGRIQIYEGQKFEMPNLSMEFEGHRLNLVGRVMELSFSLESDDKEVARFSGKRIEKGTEFKIQILNQDFPLELFFGCSLILDNLYHNY